MRILFLEHSRKPNLKLFTDLFSRLLALKEQICTCTLLLSDMYVGLQDHFYNTSRNIQSNIIISPRLSPSPHSIPTFATLRCFSDIDLRVKAFGSLFVCVRVCMCICVCV